MPKNHTIPTEVRRAFRDYEEGDGLIRKIGSRDGADFYRYCFPDDVLIGLPIVVMHKEGHVVTLDADEAHDVCMSFCK